MTGAGLSVVPGGSLSAQAHHWAGPLRQAFERMSAGGPGSGAGDLDDLPLVEVLDDPVSDLMTLFYSGDGGWAPLDADMAEILAEHGVWTVGVNSLRYFWVRKTPEEMAADAETVLRHYLPAWNRQRFVLIGYSLGADALPFIASRLPEDLRQRLALVVMLSPGQETDLEFEVSDWVSSEDTDAAKLQVGPEVARLAGLRVLCLYGVEDEGALCPLLSPQEAEVEGLPGSHHFKGDYAGLAHRTLQALGLGGRR